VHIVFAVLKIETLIIFAVMEQTIGATDFDLIRPFKDEEVPAAIERLLTEPSFAKALQYVFPDKDPGKVKQVLEGIRSTKEFQEIIISEAVKNIVRASTHGLEVSGLEKLDPSTPWLFISNHRDIVLDSAFLNYLLFLKDFPTTRIAIGSNLLQRPWIEDLVKLNKNFIVHRDVHSRQAYDYSMRLSGYIRTSLLNDNSSVWIAQREGRTKNGADRTQAGLLKMFGLSGSHDLVESYAALNIVPVSISYEYEPNAGMKAWELFRVLKDGTYQKKEGEDLESMKNGIFRNKGRVRFVFGDKLKREDLEAAMTGLSRNEAMKELAALLDRHILGNYVLSPFNYLADDLLSNSSKYFDKYSESDKAAFEKHYNEQLAPFKENDPELKRIFLGIYANPVGN